MWCRYQQRAEKSRISKQLSKQHGLCLSDSYSTRHGYEDLLLRFLPGKWVKLRV